VTSNLTISSLVDQGPRLQMVRLYSFLFPTLCYPDFLLLVYVIR
jgi:hypothetical protein